MSTKTKNLNLIKPEENDHVNIKDINDNMDKIDEKAVTFETLQKEIEKRQPIDTGWLTVTNFSNSCDHYGVNSTVKVRQYGKMVQIVGAATNVKELATKYANGVYPSLELFKLPKEIGAPEKNIRFIQQGSGLNRFTLIIDPSSKSVKLERYGTTEGVNIPANQWLNVTCSYMVAD